MDEYLDVPNDIYDKLGEELEYDRVYNDPKVQDAYNGYLQSKKAYDDGNRKTYEEELGRLGNAERTSAKLKLQQWIADNGDEEDRRNAVLEEAARKYNAEKYTEIVRAALEMREQGNVAESAQLLEIANCIKTGLSNPFVIDGVNAEFEYNPEYLELLEATQKEPPVPYSENYMPSDLGLSFAEYPDFPIAEDAKRIKIDKDSETFKKLQAMMNPPKVEEKEKVEEKPKKEKEEEKPKKEKEVETVGVSPNILAGVREMG